MKIYRPSGEYSGITFTVEISFRELTEFLERINKDEYTLSGKSGELIRKICDEFRPEFKKERKK